MSLRWQKYLEGKCPQQLMIQTALNCVSWIATAQQISSSVIVGNLQMRNIYVGHEDGNSLPRFIAILTHRIEVCVYYIFH